MPFFDLAPRWDLKADRELLRLVGYIARWPEEDLSLGEQKLLKYVMPKGFPKSTFLYGLDQAIATEGPVVICEGVTVVWRMGQMAVGLIGKTLSAQQQELIHRHFQGRPLVVLLDVDA